MAISSRATQSNGLQSRRLVEGSGLGTVVKGLRFRLDRNGLHKTTMTTTVGTPFIRRDPATITPWAETCGEIRCVIEESDGAAGEVHHVRIQDAKLHYHAKTDEFYYVIDGSGTMRLDDAEIPLSKGVVVYIPRGVKHKAWGDLTVLTICIPRGVLHDVHELE